MADERPYFTMKLIKGRTLAALFAQRKNPAYNRGKLLDIFESVCQTVAYAHSKGVLHRDLKPANVMVGAFGEVQVVDWGLAKVLRRGGVADEKRAQDTIQTVIETVRSGPGSVGSDSMVGSIMGTPAYMAPEQAQGEIEMLDERADVFSLGAILCELLTGKPPYVELEGDSILAQAGHAKLKPARERIEQSEADPALVRLCLDCLMTAREMRPPWLSAPSIKPASVRSKALASRTSTTAVGLTSARSILLMVALETPERSARSARDQPRLSRSRRRRRASWAPDLSTIADICL
jgi:serine/threonine protein kinase